MATRIYQDLGLAAPVAPASWSAGWNKTSEAEPDIGLRIAPVGLFANGTAASPGTGVSGEFTAVRRCISLALGGQTISGTVKGQILCFEDSAALNATVAFALKVVKPDGSDRGVLLAVSASDSGIATPPEMSATGFTNRTLLDSAESSNVALTQVAVQSGDYLVWEIGFRQQSSETIPAGQVRTGSDLTLGDLPENNTGTTILNPWIEFSQDISFLPQYFHSSAAVPPDNDATGVADAVTSTLVPPTGMLAGDLVVVCGQVGNATTGNITVANAGGQTWTGPYEQAGNDQNLCIYWCTFNGTWGANPTFACAALSGTQPYSVIMHVWRPPSTSYTWALDVTFSGANLAAATTATITGQTTVAANTVTLATWCTADDNTWSNLAGTGWAAIGPAQQRNLAGADQSMTWANFISATAGTATGNVSKDMGGVGTDAGVTGIVTLKAVSANVSITSGLGQLTIAGQAPTVFVLDSKAVSAGLGQLVIAGQAPTLTITEKQFAAPGVGELVITGQQPTVAKTDNVFITAALGALTLTGYEPTVSKHITVGLGELTLAAYAPSLVVTAGTQVTTGVGTLTLSGLAPVLSISDNVFIAANVGALTLAGLAPVLTKTDHVFVSPGVGTITITGFAPTLASTANVFITPVTGELTLAGQAPALSVTNNVFIAPLVGALLVTGYTPVVAKTDNVFITAGLGALTLDGLAPQVGGNFVINPAVGTLTLAGFAPAVAKTDHVSISAGLGALTLTGQAPLISVTDNIFITTDLGQLALTGVAPSISVTSNIFVDTSLATLTITGYAPVAVVSAGGNVSVNPGLGALTVTGLAPSLTVSGGSVVTFFTGVSTADGVTHFKGISRPTVQLADAGGGTYTVTKTHELSGNLKPDALHRETYLIDGELP